MAIFSQTEIWRRQQDLASALKATEVDAAFIHTADNVYYLTGVPLLSEWGRPVLAGITQGGESIVVGAGLEKGNLERYGHTDRIHAYDDSAEVWHAATNAVVEFVTSQTRGPARLGVELSYLNLRTHQALKDALTDVELVDISPDIDQARIVKSEEEVRLLLHGAELAKVGAATFIERLAFGVSELEVASAAVDAMNRALAEIYPEGATSSYAYAHFGDHTFTPHLHPTGRQLEAGDVIGLNVFPVIWGYCIELERTLYLGNGPQEGLDVLASVTEVHNKTIDAVKPGVVLGELHDVATAQLAESGLGSFVRHGTGHAHGIMIGATSREALGELRSYNKSHFRPNMFTSIEPAAYVPGLGGFRHSDVLHVTNDGHIKITGFETPFVL